MFPSLPILSLALSGLDPAALNISAQSPGDLIHSLIAFVTKQNLRAVQLDATAPSIRPRELDRSGRRGLAALLRRNQLACSGLDLFIPPEHFAQSHTVDRAVNAVLDSIDLAADLSTLSSGAIVTRLASVSIPISLALPVETPADVLKSLAFEGARRGVRLADHAWPIPDRTEKTETAVGEPHALGIGLDPAAILASGADPAHMAAKLADRIVSARLTDIAKGIGATRTAPGSPQGKLDVLAYLVALATGPKLSHAILDLRGVQHQRKAIATAQSLWPE